MPDRMTTEEVLNRAESGMRRIAEQGPRGVTMTTFDEIEAMAILLGALVAHVGDAEIAALKGDVK